MCLREKATCTQDELMWPSRPGDLSGVLTLSDGPKCVGSDTPAMDFAHVNSSCPTGAGVHPVRRFDQTLIAEAKLTKLARSISSVSSSVETCGESRTRPSLVVVVTPWLK